MSWRVVIVIVVTATFVAVAVLVVRRWLALLIAQMQDAAIAVFIDAIEPAAPQRVVIESVVVFRVVAENPGRAETVANQRARIFFSSGRDPIIYLHPPPILTHQLSPIKS